MQKSRRESNRQSKGGLYVKNKVMGISFLVTIVLSVFICCASFVFGKGDSKVVIYSNADEEALTAIEHALDESGYQGQYILQSFGTSELGGKLMVEGGNLEADLVTMSSYYLETAQAEHNMFLDLTYDTNTLQQYPSYYAPVTALEGALFVNTEAMQELNLPMPTSIADLADPIYAGVISVPDITGSSTAWLMVQAIIDTYGNDQEGQAIMQGIIQNAGPHLEGSGSGPIKKVHAGEVAIAFGLRHQAVADKNEGLPIDYIDPAEGNYMLTESVAVLDKGDHTNPLAMKMAQVITTQAREELIQVYPVALYEGETLNTSLDCGNVKTFSSPLTLELLKQHQRFMHPNS